MKPFIAWLRQPLVHFLVAGAAIFGLFAALDDTQSGTAQQEIIVTSEKAEQLAAGFQSVWRRAPTDQELSGLIDDFIREEVLVREATALSLDRNDTVIRRRLRQKMEFLTDSAAGALEPSDDELLAFFDENRERYASETEIAFDQVYVGADPSADDIDEVREALEAKTEHTLIGEPTLLPASLGKSAEVSVDGTFGRGFFEQLTTLDVNGWDGPIQSGYGAHIVRITERADGGTLPFETVRDDVLRDWTKAKADEIAEEQMARMLERYEITRPDVVSLESSSQ